MSSLIERAQAFATRAHEGATRKFTGEPYVTHPQQVAERAAALSDATDEMVAAAWLHDVVEDTSYTEDDIAAEFGDVVASLVMELTNPSKLTTGLSREQKKQLDREHLAQISLPAKRIKLLDRLHNLSCRIDLAPREFSERYLRETDILLEQSLGGVDADLEQELRDLVAALRKAIED